MARLWIDPSEPDYVEDVAFQCDKCGEDIWVGDDYYDTDDGCLCESCADDYFWELKMGCKREAEREEEE